MPTLIGAEPAPRVQPKAFTPDPASVRRYGPAYKYPQQGWTVLHVEGSPYDRGYQHGRLMAAEIESYIETLARYRDPKSPADGWRELKNTANALFFRRYDKEYLEEMKGIADGAAAGGAKAYGTPLELLDIVALNSEIESVFVDEALAATAHGLEGKRYREPAEGHCSAFVATGPATADGKAMLGHITMWNLYHARHFFVWIDIQPADGHRVVMQTYPGGIMSGMDYYQNDAGIAVCETTLDQTDFNVDGVPLCSRIRRALQYGDSIDDVVATLSEGNNGLYSNEWLIADAKTDEVAMFELGTHAQRLWRSGKDEWFGGTKGFYWGCNNAKDLQVRLETVPGVDGRPANVVFHPSDRDRKWLELFDSRRGSIGADFGFEAFTTPPLCAWPSLDAKFATSDMIKDLKSYAIFGPPLGRTWEPTAAERSRYPDTGPLVSNDWTVLTTAAPRTADGDRVAVDLEVKHLAAHASEPDGPRPPAWHGTILPKASGDVWLASAFADFERIVALEKALKAGRSEGKLADSDREHLDLALFGPTSRYLSVRARLGRDLALPSIEPDPRDDTWYEIAAGRGVLVLAELRKTLGSETFDALMDEFGRAHAGKPATTSGFFEAAAEAHGKPLDDLRDASLGADPLSRLGGDAAARWESGRFWSVNAFESDLEDALIVYGTRAESAAQREAAERLQGLLRRRWSNITVPIKSDRELVEADRTGRHLILIGRPETNAVAAELAASLPVSFGPASFTLRGRTYAHPASALIVAGPNPRDRAHSVVLFAGLGAGATWDVVERLPFRGASAEAVLVEAGGSAREMVLPARDGTIKSAAAGR
jgi:hypothetical protein